MYIGKEGFETSTVLTIAVGWLLLHIMYRRGAAQQGSRKKKHERMLTEEDKWNEKMNTAERIGGTYLDTMNQEWDLAHGR